MITNSLIKSAADILSKGPGFYPKYSPPICKSSKLNAFKPEILNFYGMGDKVQM
jgi:hypothetical protein